MKLLSFKTKHVDTKLVMRSNKPMEVMFVDEGQRGQSLAFKNKVVFFVCVEKRDEKRPVTAELATDAIRKTLQDHKSSNVLLIPFVHLTGRPASPKKAYMIIKEIENRLATGKYKVDRFQFGWHRTLCMDIFCGREMVSFTKI